MKTLKAKNKICLMAILFSLFSMFTIFYKPLTANAQVATYANNAYTSAKSMVVIESDSKRVLYSKNKDEKLPMASTTKIVTALTVLNNYKENINKEVDINDKAVGIPGTSIYLKKGERLSVKELLYGLMLPSGNDAATALAYIVGGSVPNFCTLMKQTAESVGAVNSNFTNPHGLDENGHYTTASDLALITAKALENETFKDIVTTKNVRIKGSTEGTYRYLRNKNKLLNTLDGAIGVKTGFTNKAGRCLVSACERDGFRTICVVLNCGPMFEESALLLNKAYEDYKKVELLPSYKIHRSVSVEEGREPFVKVFSRRGYSYPITEEERVLVEYKYDLPNTTKAPVKKDEIIGKVEIYLNNCLLFSEKIYTMDNVKKIGVWSNIKDIISKF